MRLRERKERAKNKEKRKGNIWGEGLGEWETRRAMNAWI